MYLYYKSYYSQLKPIFIAFIIMIICILLSCNKDNRNNKANSEPKISYRAKFFNQKLEPTQLIPDQEMGFLFPVGQFTENESQNIKTILLTKQFAKGRNIKTKPIGSFSFMIDTTAQNYIISVPADSSLNTMNINNFFEFNTYHFEIKNLIEDWFRANCKLGKCSDFKWGNEFSAHKIMAKG